MDKLIADCREMIREVERRKAWLCKHNFQEEARVLQTKIGGMFQIYDELVAYKDRVAK